MAFNKRIIDRIDKACKDDEAMRDFLHEVIVYEMSGNAKHYTKDYEGMLRKHAFEEGDRQ